MSTPILIRNWQSVGDTVVLTAFVRDLALAFPGRYKVTVNTPHPDVWLGNPYIASHVISFGAPQNKGEVYTLPYTDFIPKHHKDFNHYIGAYHQSFKKLTGVSVPLTEAKADLHISQPAEFKKPAERYWVIVGGSKSDFQVKQWNNQSCQKLINYLNCSGITVVQAGKNGGPQAGKHPELKGVINLVDKTNVRELIQLIAGAEGVISPVTAAMHIAAALDKPAVVLAGGAEEWWWEAYTADNPSFKSVKKRPNVSHRYLHTLGLLSCCKKMGCWKRKVYEGPKNAICIQRLEMSDQTIPKCMNMISPERVYRAITSYYSDGTLAEIKGMKMLSNDELAASDDIQAI